MNQQELKTAALLERIANLTTDYENQVADLRVELTVLTDQVQQLSQQPQQSQPEVIEGTVVE